LEKKKKNYKNLGVGYDLTEFTKIPKLEYFKYIHINIKVILGIFTWFNKKSKRMGEIEKNWKINILNWIFLSLGR
jgi:hypothetical protein